MENRKSPRRNATLEIELSYPSGDKKIVSSRDISDGGIFLILDQLDRTISYISNIKKLNINRIDMVVQSWEVFSNFAKELSINPDFFETVYLVDTKDIFYAFHKETPDWIIKKFQKAFDKLKEEGKLDDLTKLYKKIEK